MNGEHTPHGARIQLLALSMAMILGMAPWFSATVVAPAMIAEWRTGATTSAWLTIGVQAGFVIGTCVSAVLLLTDRFSARRLAAGSACIVALATALLTLRAVDAGTAVVLRGAAGAALAGVYPPGIKLAAGWWRRRRGTAIGILIGALTIGSASPNLFRAVVSASNWRGVILLAAVSSLASAALFWFVVREGPFQSESVRFEAGAVVQVLRDPGVILATAGYLGHMWELFAMWGSIGAFWAHVATRHAVSSAAAAVLAFTTIGAGAIGCVVAGIAADRIGRPLVTIVAMALSGACALVIGSTISAPIIVVATVAIVWGISIVADSAQFSAAVTELAPEHYVGTAVTLQTSIGFLLTIVTIRSVPEWVVRWGWERAYMPLAIGPALGILAMWRLSRISQP